MHPLRKLAALALAVLAPLLASAAAPPPAADLTVLAGQGQRFLLALDGRPLTGYATRQLHVSWLAPGRHLADVQVYSPYGPPVAFRTTIWLQPGVDSRFALASGPYGAALQPLGGAPGYGGYGAPGASYSQAPAPYGGYGAAPYGGAYPAPGQPAPYGNNPVPGGYGDPYGGITAPGGAYPGQPSYGSGAAPSGAYTAPGQPSPYGGTPAPGGAYPGQPAPYSNHAPGSTYPGQPNPISPAPGTYLTPLSTDDLNRLAQELRQQPADALRLESMQQTLNGRSLQASELARLLDYLGSEQSRVQLVLQAYEHLADPSNMGRVYQRLQPGSVAEVQRVLAGQGAY